MTPRPPDLAPWWGRLEAQLLVGFLVAALLPAAMAAGAVTWQTGRTAERYVGDHVERSASAYATGLDLYIERQRSRLRDLQVEPIDAEGLTSAVRVDASLVALWFDGPSVASTPGPSDWARAACAGLAASGTDGPLVSHAGEGEAHEVVVGVRRVEGMLCGQVTFTPHQEMLTEQADNLLGGAAYVVDRQGNVVCYSSEDDQPHVPRGALLSPEVADVARGGRTWSGMAGTASGRRFAAFAPASELPWGVWVEVPADIAVSPFRAGLLRGAGLAGVGAVLAALVAVAYGRRLAAPVRTLVGAAGRVSGGGLGTVVPVDGPAEIAALALAFNRMSAALAQSHARLEERVAARTAELAQARAFSDRLLDTLRQRILVIDPDLNVVKANAAALDAYGDAVLGCGCRAVHETPADEECPASRVLRTGVSEREERRRARAGGSEILDVETVRLCDEDARILGVLEVAEDVTEIRRIHERLARHEKLAAVGNLAAGLAHEIGNPLASMSSELEMLERSWDPDEARAALPVLREQIRRIARLLRELVDFGRPPSDRLERFDPEGVLEEVSRLLRHDPRSEGVEVVVECGGVAVLRTKRDRLVQVLVNLGLNALDAVESRGRVTLRAISSVAGEVRFEVADDGPGVPPEERARLFDPFYTTKEQSRGTGLGLFVSQRIAAELGGRLELAPGGPGACFLLSVPDISGEEVAS